MLEKNYLMKFHSGHIQGRVRSRLQRKVGDVHLSTEITGTLTVFAHLYAQKVTDSNKCLLINEAGELERFKNNSLFVSAQGAICTERGCEVQIVSLEKITEMVGITSKCKEEEWRSYLTVWQKILKDYTDTL